MRVAGYVMPAWLDACSARVVAWCVARPRSRLRRAVLAFWCRLLQLLLAMGVWRGLLRR